MLPQCPLGGKAIVGRAQEPEVRRFVSASRGVGPDVIDLKRSGCAAARAVGRHKSAPPAVTDEHFVSDRRRNVTADPDGPRLPALGVTGFALPTLGVIDVALPTLGVIRVSRAGGCGRGPRGRRR